MAKFSLFSTAIWPLYLVFHNSMYSLQQTITSSKIQNNGDCEITAMEERIQNRMETAVISLVSSRTKQLEKVNSDIQEKVEYMSAKLKYKGEEWETYNGVHYYFSSHAVQWETAVTNCGKLGGHLVSIPSADINSFLVRNGKNSEYWTGGNDKDREGGWLWNFQQVYMTYTDWKPGEPNNAANEDCLVLTTAPDNTNHWNDGHCNSYLRYICQITEKSFITG